MEIFHNYKELALPWQMSKSHATFTKFTAKKTREIYA